MTATELEARVEALEKRVARLARDQRNSPTESHAWLDKVFGIYKDNQEFEEAVKAGQEWRNSEVLEESEAI